MEGIKIMFKKLEGKWKKKISILICVLALTVCITGCYYADEYYESDIDYKSWETETDEYEEGWDNCDIDYTFRNEGLLESHYEKHGEEMGFSSPEEYQAAANNLIDNEDVLHKKEAEDGDDVYYLEETNEFVVVSQDGYIRTYFFPSDGIDYYNRQ